MNMKVIYASVFAGVLLLVGCTQSGTTPAVEGTDDDNQFEEASEQTDEQNNTSDTTEGDDQTKKQEGKSSNNGSDGQEISEQLPADDGFNKGRATAVLTDYEKAFKMVINYSTDEGKLKEYHTKEALKGHFIHFMTDELAQNMVDTYFKEKEDGVYVRAMDGPVFLQENEPFTFTKTEQGTAIVQQERNNELIGHIVMEFILMNRDGFWIVKEVNRLQPNEK